MIIISAILPTEIVVLPSIIGSYAEQDSPFAILLSSTLGMVFAALIGSLVKDTKGTPFLDWVGNHSSPLVATILGLIMLQYYLDTTASIFREFINFIKDNILTNTPVILLTGIVAIVTLYIASRGIDAIARINTLVVIFTVLFIPVYIIGLKNLSDLHRLLPLFQHSFPTLMVASLTPASWMSEMSVLLFLTPYLRYPEKARASGFYGQISIFIFMIITMIVPLAVYGTEFIKSATYPGFSAIGIIRFGDFFENLDVLFISYWILSVYIKMSIFLFATIQCFKQTFHVKKGSPYGIALVLIIALECVYTWKSPTVLNNYNIEARFPVFMFVNFLVPLFIFLWFRGKKAVSK